MIQHQINKLLLILSIALINGSKDERLEDYNDKDQTVSSEEKNEVSEIPKVNTEVDKVK